MTLLSTCKLHYVLQCIFPHYFYLQTLTLNELLLQNKEYSDNQDNVNLNEKLTTNYWKKQYIFNVFPHNSTINDDNLMNDEEYVRLLTATENKWQSIRKKYKFFKNYGLRKKEKEARSE